MHNYSEGIPFLIAEAFLTCQHPTVDQRLAYSQDGLSMLANWTKVQAYLLDDSALQVKLDDGIIAHRMTRKIHNSSSYLLNARSSYTLSSLFTVDQSVNLSPLHV